MTFDRDDLRYADQQQEKGMTLRDQQDSAHLEAEAARRGIPLRKPDWTDPASAHVTIQERIDVVRALMNMRPLGGPHPKRAIEQASVLIARLMRDVLEGQVEIP